jgi:hypothetical protein
MESMPSTQRADGALSDALERTNWLTPIWRDATGAEVWEARFYEHFLRAVQASS